MKRATDLRECLACSCFAVRRAARAITQQYDRCLKPTGLKATQFTVLVVLALGGRMPLSQAAEQLGTERTTLTRNLRRLIARGLVTVASHPDRRIQLLEATPRGVAAALEALPYWRTAQLSIGGFLTPAALRSLEVATQAASRARSSGSRRSTGRKKEG
jgi:DNA-binding MarR family transcriptional regulator